MTSRKKPDGGRSASQWLRERVFSSSRVTHTKVQVLSTTHCTSSRPARPSNSRPGPHLPPLNGPPGTAESTPQWVHHSSIDNNLGGVSSPQPTPRHQSQLVSFGARPNTGRADKDCQRSRNTWLTQASKNPALSNNRLMQPSRNADEVEVSPSSSFRLPRLTLRRGSRRTAKVAPEPRPVPSLAEVPIEPHEDLELYDFDVNTKRISGSLRDQHLLPDGGLPRERAASDCAGISKYTMVPRERVNQRQGGLWTTWQGRQSGGRTKEVEVGNQATRNEGTCGQHSADDLGDKGTSDDPLPIRRAPSGRIRPICRRGRNNSMPKGERISSYQTGSALSKYDEEATRYETSSSGDISRDDREQQTVSIKRPEMATAAEEMWKLTDDLGKRASLIRRCGDKASSRIPVIRSRKRRELRAKALNDATAPSRIPVLRSSKKQELRRETSPRHHKKHLGSFLGRLPEIGQLSKRRQCKVNLESENDGPCDIDDVYRNDGGKKLKENIICIPTAQVIKLRENKTTHEPLKRIESSARRSFSCEVEMSGHTTEVIDGTCDIKVQSRYQQNSAIKERVILTRKKTDGLSESEELCNKKSRFDKDKREEEFNSRILPPQTEPYLRQPVKNEVSIGSNRRSRLIPEIRMDILTREAGSDERKSDGNFTRSSKSSTNVSLQSRIAHGSKSACLSSNRYPDARWHFSTYFAKWRSESAPELKQTQRSKIPVGTWRRRNSETNTNILHRIEAARETWLRLDIGEVNQRKSDDVLITAPGKQRRTGNRSKIPVGTWRKRNCAENIQVLRRISVARDKWSKVGIRNLKQQEICNDVQSDDARPALAKADFEKFCRIDLDYYTRERASRKRPRPVSKTIHRVACEPRLPTLLEESETERTPSSQSFESPFLNVNSTNMKGDAVSMMQASTRRSEHSSGQLKNGQQTGKQSNPANVRQGDEEVLISFVESFQSEMLSKLREQYHKTNASIGPTPLTTGARVKDIVEEQMDGNEESLEVVTEDEVHDEEAKAKLDKMQEEQWELASVGEWAYICHDDEDEEEEETEEYLRGSDYQKEDIITDNLQKIASKFRTVDAMRDLLEISTLRRCPKGPIKRALRMFGRICRGPVPLTKIDQTKAEAVSALSANLYQRIKEFLAHRGELFEFKMMHPIFQELEILRARQDRLEEYVKSEINIDGKQHYTVKRKRNVNPNQPLWELNANIMGYYRRKVQSRTLINVMSTLQELPEED